MTGVPGPNPPDRPLDYTSEPGSFGESYPIPWNQPRSLDRLIGLRHAEIQHEFCGLLRRHLNREQVSQKEFVVAGERGEWFNLQRLRRCMNGQAWLSLDDMVLIDEMARGLMVHMRYSKTPLDETALALVERGS